MNNHPFNFSRRRHPRVRVDGTLKARDLTQGALVGLRDVSESGFQTEGAHVPTMGEPHTFSVRLRSRQSCILEAIAVHCRVFFGPATRCVVGWRLADEATYAPAIRAVIEDVTTLRPSALTSEEPKVFAWAIETPKSSQ